MISDLIDQTLINLDNVNVPLHPNVFLLDLTSFSDFYMLFFIGTDMRQHTIYPDCDIKFTGHVTWVGKTSIEVKMHVSQVDSLHSLITHGHTQNCLRV